MAEASAVPPKLDPDRLILRASPRRVIRFKRGLLITVAAVGCLGLFTLVGLALNHPTPRFKVGDQELYNTDRKPMADELSALPANYGQVQKPVPQLGPPLPGDIGRAVVANERDNGITSGSDGYQPNPEADLARAERMRLAQQVHQAHEAGVFFQLAQPQSGEQGSAQNTQTTQPSGPGNELAAATPAGDSNPLGLDLNRDQNDQQRKLAFANQQQAQGIYNRYPLQDAASPYEVLAGTVISASLITGINSDLPGLVIAQVTEDIYDTVSGRFLLIPQGARLIGSYDSVIAFHQSRALLVWNRIVMPDGSSIQIENLPATDTSGYAGLQDQVDYHTWALLKGVVLSTMLGVGTELSLGNEQSDLVRAIEESTQQNVNRAGQQVTGKNLQIQPTLTVRQGWPLRIVVSKDLILKPYRG